MPSSCSSFHFLALLVRFLGVPRPLGVPATGVPEPCLEVFTLLRLIAGLLAPRLRVIFDLALFMPLPPALFVGRGIDDCLLFPALPTLELLPFLFTATSFSRGGGDEALPSLSIDLSSEDSVSMELFMVSSVN